MKDYNETLARLFDLDAEQGLPQLYAHKQYVTDKESFRICDDGSRDGETPNIGFNADTEQNAKFLASIHEMMQVIRHQQEVIERLTKQRDMAVEGLEKIASGEGRTVSGKKRYYSCYDSLQGVAKQTLAAIEAGKE